MGSCTQCGRRGCIPGLPPFAWEPDKGTHIAFIPRKGTVADVKWVTAPPSYVFHPMNHFETADGKVVIDVVVPGT